MPSATMITQATASNYVLQTNSQIPQLYPQLPSQASAPQDDFVIPEFNDDEQIQVSHLEGKFHITVEQSH